MQTIIVVTVRNALQPRSGGGRYAKMITFGSHRDDDSNDLESGDSALVRLLALLKQRGYRFVTPTPATHARVVARPLRRTGKDLRDVFGWNLPFAQQILDPEMRKVLVAADALTTMEDGRLRSRYRVSTLGDDLFLHSSFPTQAADSVFFGPDSYRFADFIGRELARCPYRPGSRLVDIGAGAGVGGIVAAKLGPDVRVTMTDINPRALRLARINAKAARVEAEYAFGAHLESVDGAFDIILANPPYIIDPAGRTYRDGGDMRGAGVARDMAVAAVKRLAPGGLFLLYTGSPISEGEDSLRRALADLVHRHGRTLRYREIDPDMFGEELEKSAYCDVERIAIVGAVIHRPT